MKRFLLIIICITLLTSCNDEIDLLGRAGTSKFLQNNFSGISVQDGFELYLNRGTIMDTIRIEADENILNHVKYEIKNNILYFYKEQGIEFPSEALVRIYVTRDSIDALTISSSAKVQLTDTIRTDELRLVCIDRSVLTGRLECKKIQSYINNSTLEITGLSSMIRMNIDNGSSTNLLGMESNNAHINISGGSFAEISVSDEIELKAIERSVLHYKGTAIIRSLILDDDSKIKKLD